MEVPGSPDRAIKEKGRVERGGKPGLSTILSESRIRNGEGVGKEKDVARFSSLLLQKKGVGGRKGNWLFFFFSECEREEKLEDKEGSPGFSLPFSLFFKRKGRNRRRKKGETKPTGLHLFPPENRRKGGNKKGA